MEIRTYTILEIDCLADVDDRPLLVAIKVTTRFGWEGGKNSLNLFRNFHREQFYRLSGYLLNSVTFALQSCSNSCIAPLSVQ